MLNKIKKQKLKGFTLIELVVVMVILGILASMIGPSFLDFRRKIDLDYSVQNFRTALSEAFSSSRSKSRIYGVGIGGRQENEDAEYTNKKINKFSYDYKSCMENGRLNLTEECLQTKISVDENFLGTTHIIEGTNNVLSGGFFIYFLPPHGDISWNGILNGNTEEEGVLEVIMVDDYENKRSFKIYEKSGLIE